MFISAPNFGSSQALSVLSQNSRKMFYFGIFLAAILFDITKLTCATDYCDPTLCTTYDGKFRHHIGCNNNQRFLDICEEASIIPVTSRMQQLILEEHNDLRNKVANGTLNRYKSARRMTTLTWDEELAYLAGLNTLTCEMNHDACHNTVNYKHAGQNLAILYSNIQYSPDSYQEYVIYLINEWFNEHIDADQGIVDMYNSRAVNLPQIGHFTAMIHDKSSKVGCALSKFVKIRRGERARSLLLACNYSFTNMIDMPIYVKGKTGSGCETGRNPKFPGLCSVNEDVPPLHDLELPANYVSRSVPQEIVAVWPFDRFTRV